MKKRKESIWCLQFCLSILLLTVSSLISLAEASVKITIVQSNDNDYFELTRQSLYRQLGADFQLLVISVDAIDSQQELLSTSDIIVTLGINAALEISDKITNRRIISAYITQKQQQQFRSRLENHTIVLLNQPLSRYLAFTGLLLHPHSIGIINQKNIILDGSQNKMLSQFKIKLRQYELRPETNPLASVRNLIKYNDVHLMLPEEKIYNRNTLKGILLTSYRSRKPVISYSPSHVKSGALASIYSSPADIGSHLVSIVRRWVGRSGREKPGIEFAQFFSVAVNNKVAHALGFNLPDKSQLISRLKEVLR